MMAFDRTPAGEAIDPAMAEELRAVLSRSIRAGNHGEDLKDVLCRAAAAAKSRNIQAEQVLIALKDIWYSLPELSADPGNERQTRLLQQLVARCIQEYYGG